MATASEKVRLFRHVERGFYDETGSINIENLRKELGLTLEQIAKAVGKNIRTLQKNSHSRAIQQRLIQIVAVLTLLNELIDNPQEGQVWLNAPHPDFAGMTPKQLIVEGKAQALVDYLNEIRTGALR
ncbi:antitoxin Xre/MbcA/ParS toxin-binding domain-containing protein [Candidatus Manganitrophus noduliformans]|nr:antitoxin Xre/MbcA/ParS toxin-binding domain-containing protein [Candidatus Manganitrophus noduliformans]